MPRQNPALSRWPCGRRRLPRPTSFGQAGYCRGRNEFPDYPAGDVQDRGARPPPPLLDSQTPMPDQAKSKRMVEWPLSLYSVQLQVPTVAGQDVPTNNRVCPGARPNPDAQLARHVIPTEHGDFVPPCQGPGLAAPFPFPVRWLRPNCRPFRVSAAPSDRRAFRGLPPTVKMQTQIQIE